MLVLFYESFGSNSGYQETTLSHLTSPSNSFRNISHFNINDKNVENNVAGHIAFETLMTNMRGKYLILETGKMPWWLRALTVLAEGLGSVPSSHTEGGAYNGL